MNISHQRKLIILLAIFVVALTTGLGCKGGDKSLKDAMGEPVELEFWGVFDPEDVFRSTINTYQSSRPNVSINYRKLRFEEYERELINAWAEGRGPDIFMVHNTWFGGYESKISPLPSKIKVPTVQIKPGLKQEKIYSFKEIVTPRPQQLDTGYIQVIADDVVRDSKIYGMPLGVDTLVLYYNRNILDQAGVKNIPRTWQDVKEASQAITRYNEEGEVERSGIALGGALNINRSFDIISLLMAQNGTEFTRSGKVTFAGGSSFSSDRSFRPGQEALRFYTDFGLSSKEVYTWSEDLPSEQELFISGRLGMMLGYAFQLPTLKAQGPKLDFGVAPIPHINVDGTDAVGETVNWANYWNLSVARATDYPDEAWDFVLFTTTEVKNAKKYSKLTGKPSAMRALLGEQAQDPDLGIFTDQLLSAQSWYRGKDHAAAEAIFDNMITSVLNGSATLRDAISQAEKQIDGTWR